MNITKENIDALNAVVKVEITAEDYQDKVKEVLQDYRKKADIPGFRKGNVPMGLVQKKYGKSVMIDEVNKLLQDSLNNFLTEEKLDILGNPLPKAQEDFTWEEENYAFEFELGLAPEFDLDLKKKNTIKHYNIVADDALLNKEVENLQSRFGKMIAKDTVEEGFTLTGTFANEDKEIENKYTFELEAIKGKTNLKNFLGAKVGDVLSLKTKNLFNEEQALIAATGLDAEAVKDLDEALTFSIEEVTLKELAPVNQDLFDKLFGEGKVTSEDDMRAKIKEDAEKQFQTQSDQMLLNGVTEYLVDNTTFELPAAFLKKWLQVAGETEISAEEAETQYDTSEKGLRYQLIEGKIMKDNNLQIQMEELKDYAKGFIKAQMAQFGNMDPEEKELEDIAMRVLSNQDESKRLADQLMSQKLLSFYKENMTFDVKEITYDAFVKEQYK
jgi:trigger factor